MNNYEIGFIVMIVVDVVIMTTFSHLLHKKHYKEDWDRNNPYMNKTFKKEITMSFIDLSFWSSLMLIVITTILWLLTFGNAGNVFGVLN